MDYQWYPGHMTKAIRQMREDIKLVDLVIELLDARIPLSSRNPDIDSLGQNKYKCFWFNDVPITENINFRQVGTSRLWQWWAKYILFLWYIFLYDWIRDRNDTRNFVSKHWKNYWLRRT